MSSLWIEGSSVDPIGGRNSRRLCRRIEAALSRFWTRVDREIVAAPSTSSSTVRPSSPCRPRATSSRSGSCAASTSTTTSSSSDTPTACRSSSSTSRSRSATPRRPSRSSSRAGVCLRTSAATTDRRPPWPSTCRAPTAPTPSGHRRASSAGPRRSDRRPVSSSPESSRAAPTRSRGTRPCSDSCGWGRQHGNLRLDPASAPRHRPRLLPLPYRQEHPRHRPGPTPPGAAGRDRPDAHPRQHP